MLHFGHRRSPAVLPPCGRADGAGPSRASPFPANDPRFNPWVWPLDRFNGLKGACACDIHKWGQPRTHAKVLQLTNGTDEFYTMHGSLNLQTVGLTCKGNNTLRFVEHAPGLYGDFSALARAAGAGDGTGVFPGHPGDKDASGVGLGGVICNSRKVDQEREFLEEFTSAIGPRMIHFVPRDNSVQKAEFNEKTVTEWDPKENQSQEYSTLAEKIINNTTFVIPKPLTMDELESMVVKYGIAD